MIYTWLMNRGYFYHMQLKTEPTSNATLTLLPIQTKHTTYGQATTISFTTSSKHTHQRAMKRQANSPISNLTQHSPQHDEDLCCFSEMYI